jgi:hypothetical protein
VERDIEIIEVLEKGLKDVKGRLTNIISRDTGAIQSKFDKQHNDTKLEIEAVRYAIKKTLKQAGVQLNDIDKGLTDHAKGIRLILKHLGLELVRGTTEVNEVTTEDRLEKIKKTAKKTK